MFTGEPGNEATERSLCGTIRVPQGSLSVNADGAVTKVYRALSTKSGSVEICRSTSCTDTGEKTFFVIVTQSLDGEVEFDFAE
jgi:hypothetical protein